MLHIQADFLKTAGKMKPMHCVNNGPVHRLRSADELHKEVCAGAPNQNNGIHLPAKSPGKCRLSPAGKAADCVIRSTN